MFGGRRVARRTGRRTARRVSRRGSGSARWTGGLPPVRRALSSGAACPGQRGGTRLPAVSPWAAGARPDATREVRR